MASSEYMNGLRELEVELRHSGLASLYVYGSASAGTLRPESDIDLFCDLAPDARLGLGFFALADRIAEVLGRAVDLTTREALHPLIRDDVTRGAVRVF